MQIQKHDRHSDQDRAPRPFGLQHTCHYSAIVPAQSLDEQGRLIDELIQFAFDTLGVCHLDLRIYEAQ